MRTFLLLIFLTTNLAAATQPETTPGSCQAAITARLPGVAPDGWLLLAALVVCMAGRWSR